MVFSLFAINCYAFCLCVQREWGVGHIFLWVPINGIWSLSDNNETSSLKIRVKSLIPLMILSLSISTGDLHGLATSLPFVSSPLSAHHHSSAMIVLSPRTLSVSLSLYCVRQPTTVVLLPVATTILQPAATTVQDCFVLQLHLRHCLQPPSSITRTIERYCRNFYVHETKWSYL
ncbi:hypothetical protein Pfo_010275 [Paulownia fortunei]|nr:hypothetical protein Pfo_010275 [Paulownia fortunei]